MSFQHRLEFPKKKRCRLLSLVLTKRIKLPIHPEVRKIAQLPLKEFKTHMQMSGLTPNEKEAIKTARRALKNREYTKKNNLTHKINSLTMQVQDLEKQKQLLLNRLAELECEQNVK